MLLGVDGRRSCRVKEGKTCGIITAASSSIISEPHKTTHPPTKGLPWPKKTICLKWVGQQEDQRKQQQ